MKIDNITVSAIVYSTEDPEKVGEAIATLFPFEFEIQVSHATGHYGNPIMFLEVEIKKKREIKEFWNHLIKLLGEQRTILIEFLDRLIDENGVLHIRIDKQQAYLGKVELAFGGDCIVVKAKLVTFPSKREKLIEFAREILSKGL
uniref:Exosome subunit n=1 Tax=Geoglobus ahangari TaxID=113653 RepID=A0A7C4WKY9_9EURY